MYLLMRTYNLAKGVSKMIKIRISYTSSTDIPNVLEALQGFKILHIGKPKPKNGYYNMYLELE